MDFLNIAMFCLLMIELVICTVAVFPFLSMSTRKKFIGSFHNLFNHHTSKIVLNVIFIIVGILFINNISESQKIDKQLHAESIVGVPVHTNERTQLLFRLFRAQRNMYLSGAVLFLSFLIARAQRIAIDLGSLEVKSETVISQAKNNQKQIDKIITENEELKEKLEQYKKMDKEFKAMKSQAESTNREYLKLQGEYEKVVGRKSDKLKKTD